jgi:hypothetical protein
MRCKHHVYTTKKKGLQYIESSIIKKSGTGFESSSPSQQQDKPCRSRHGFFILGVPSSSGLGYRPLTPKTRVRVPLGLPQFPNAGVLPPGMIPSLLVQGIPPPGRKDTGSSPVGTTRKRAVERAHAHHVPFSFSNTHGEARTSPRPQSLRHRTSHLGCVGRRPLLK